MKNSTQLISIVSLVMAISHKGRGDTGKKGEEKWSDLFFWLTTNLWYIGNIPDKQSQYWQDKEKLNAIKWYSDAHNENISPCLQLTLGFWTLRRERSDSNALLKLWYTLGLKKMQTLIQIQFSPKGAGFEPINYRHS